MINSTLLKVCIVPFSSQRFICQLMLWFSQLGGEPVRRVEASEKVQWLLEICSQLVVRVKVLRLWESLS